MEDRISYLNTDLDLVSADDLTPLTSALEALGLLLLYVEQREDSLWHAGLEPAEQYDGPEAGVAALLRAIESLSEPLAAAWAACIARELSVGYQCGNEPRSVEHGLSSPLLGRAAALGASLNIVLYAP